MEKFNWDNIKKDVDGLSDNEMVALIKKYGEHPDKSWMISMDDLRPQLDGVSHKGMRKQVVNAIIKECSRVEKLVEKNALKNSKKRDWLNRAFGFVSGAALVLFKDYLG